MSAFATIQYFLEIAYIGSGFRHRLHKKLEKKVCNFLFFLQLLNSKLFVSVATNLEAVITS